MLSNSRVHDDSGAPFARIMGSALCISLLIGAVSVGSPEDVSAGHRAALIRYLAASRTVVAIRHFLMPIAIREIAVERWGFDGMSLDSDDVLAMESHVDRLRLETAIVALHARYVTAADADEVARFYETAVGQRLIRHSIGLILPSTDPLSRQGDEAIAPQDEALFKTFFATPAARRLKAIERQLSAEMKTLVTEAADAAVAAYVRATGLRTRAGSHDDFVARRGTVEPAGNPTRHPQKNDHDTGERPRAAEEA